MTFNHDLRRNVALIAVGASSLTAVGSRIGAFAAGLARQHWNVQVVDLQHVASKGVEVLIDHLPGPLLELLEKAGVEGDVMPCTGRKASSIFRTLTPDVAVVSVPPFSLLWEAARALPNKVPLVIDYRDPWGARLSPPPLALATRPLERMALGRAAAVTYAGDDLLGQLLCRQFHIAPERVVAIANGFDPQDLEGMQPWCRRHCDGTPLDLVFGGYWYGRNGPGILPEALAFAGPSVASLTVIGGMAPSIERRFALALGYVPKSQTPVTRRELYQHLARADAAVITLDHSSAIESRVPTKCYDYLAVGIPVIVACPRNAAILRVAGADRFHHVEPFDLEGMVELLRQAARRRATLRQGQLGAGPTRQEGVAVLSHLLERVIDRSSIS